MIERGDDWHAYKGALRAVLPTVEKDPDVLQVMARSGGGFASNLAMAWLHADAINSAKLFREFGHLYRQYESALRDEQERRSQKGRDTP